MTPWEVRFWGVRGSFAECAPEFSGVGGHTSCVSVLSHDTIVIFDAGTGLIDCGRWILEKHSGLRHIFLFLSHAHLDHITGLPAFQPLLSRDFAIHIFGGTFHLYGGCENVLNTLITPPYFPVTLEQLPAEITFHDITPGESVQINSKLAIHTIALNHPDGGCGYRLADGHKSLAYLSDTTHSTETDKTFQDFCQNTNMLIYDATFTDEEFAKHPDWGHSTWREAVRLAQKAHVQNLALFHHNPTHTDTMMNAIEKEAQSLFPQAFVSKQGQIFEF